MPLVIQTPHSASVQWTPHRIPHTKYISHLVSVFAIDLPRERVAMEWYEIVYRDRIETQESS